MRRPLYVAGSTTSSPRSRRHRTSHRHSATDSPNNSPRNQRRRHRHSPSNGHVSTATASAQHLVNVNEDPDESIEEIERDFVEEEDEEEEDIVNLSASSPHISLAALSRGRISDSFEIETEALNNITTLDSVPNIECESGTHGTSCNRLSCRSTTENTAEVNDTSAQDTVQDTISLDSSVHEVGIDSTSGKNSPTHSSVLNSSVPGSSSVSSLPDPSTVPGASSSTPVPDTDSTTENAVPMDTEVGSLDQYPAPPLPPRLFKSQSYSSDCLRRKKHGCGSPSARGRQTELQVPSGSKRESQTSFDSVEAFAGSHENIAAVNPNQQAKRHAMILNSTSELGEEEVGQVIQQAVEQAQQESEEVPVADEQDQIAEESNDVIDEVIQEERPAEEEEESQETIQEEQELTEQECLQDDELESGLEPGSQSGLRTSEDEIDGPPVGEDNTAGISSTSSTIERSVSVSSSDTSPSASSSRLSSVTSQEGTGEDSEAAIGAQIVVTSQVIDQSHAAPVGGSALHLCMPVPASPGASQTPPTTPSPRVVSTPPIRPALTPSSPGPLRTPTVYNMRTPVAHSVAQILQPMLAQACAVQHPPVERPQSVANSAVDTGPLPPRNSQHQHQRRSLSMEAYHQHENTHPAVLRTSSAGHTPRPTRHSITTRGSGDTSLPQATRHSTGSSSSSLRVGSTSDAVPPPAPPPRSNIPPPPPPRDSTTTLSDSAPVPLPEPTSSASSDPPAVPPRESTAPSGSGSRTSRQEIQQELERWHQQMTEAGGSPAGVGQQAEEGRQQVWQPRRPTASTSAGTVIFVFGLNIVYFQRKWIRQG